MGPNTEQSSKVELHLAVTDYSLQVCRGTVAYLRSQLRECSSDLISVIGKCRIAPIRHLSLHRLELQAAVMTVILTEQIFREHKIKIHSCFFRSDSTTVLQWIHSSHCKQQVLLAYQVAAVLDKTDVSKQKH